jgi:GntR family transcriptional regulator
MEELIHRENPQKLYIQLSEIMRRKIESKDWDVGFQIPTEEELCKTYGVSRATVRGAISELVRHGYLIRKQGKGTFVFKKVMSDELSMLTSFREPMLEAGINFSTALLAQTTIMPLDDLSIKLNIPVNEHVIYIKRLWSVDNKPVLIQETFIPVHICSSLLEEDVMNNSLFELFEKKYGIPITQVRNYFDITYLNKEEGKLFSLAEGSPALLLNQHFFSWEKHIMYTRSVNRPDGFKFLMEFEKTF